METFDAIVLGNGLAGAAISYELAGRGLSVLLIDGRPPGDAPSATRYSYGVVTYWAGGNDLTRPLWEAGLTKQRQLPEELGADTQFREMDFLLTIPPEFDRVAIQAEYQALGARPEWLTPRQAQALEPLLNPQAIGAALLLRQGHVSPPHLIRAYNQAFQRLGGSHLVATVTDLVRVKHRVTGVLTAVQAYPARQVVLAAGACSRPLLRSLGVVLPLYHTQAELIETGPSSLTLRTQVMAAVNQRVALEAQASQPHQQPLWDRPDQEVVPPILDSAAIQFQDGHFCLGQISRTLTSLDSPVSARDQQQSDRRLRAALAALLPEVATLPGTWHRCLVSFTADGLPLVGALPTLAGLSLFTGFTAPFVLVPPLAQRLAEALVDGADPGLAALQPGRFPLANSLPGC
ncbi:MAG: NAD(P)/FAD-dependent oxidoreductase [Nodosilinea sp.]|jgi:glycine/D-amino acid oxidase-like deaminating enzyme